MLLIPTSGSNFSWTNCKQGNRRISSKIDRDVVNEDWWRSFPNASIRMLPQTTSDHNPQILYCFGQVYFAKRLFRFKAMWTKDKRSHWVVNQAWWSLNSNLRGHLEHLLKLKETLWLQKSRLKWQTDGDQCTRFFFLSTLARRKNNIIEYHTPDYIDLSHLISPSILAEENPEWDEIRNTVSRMGSFKAAGPDGIWNFLNYVLTAFGFHPRWIRWALLCYSTTYMTLMLNGVAFHSFRPKRGLRQGDPISSYLFILCMEVLSRLINQKVVMGHIVGFKLDRHISALYHLFFVDNIFLMGKCTVNEAFYFKECFDTFCNWSSQSFNTRKSNSFFNNRANGQSSGLIASMMGFDKISLKSSYLGLPLFRSGFSKDFNFLLEKLESKLASWKSEVLSKAKRMVLIKSIALSLPVYTMQSMKLPKSVCAKLDAIIRNFWWSAFSSDHSLCLKAWSDICQPKQWGSLGFRRMHDLNISLLAKWAWSILQGKNSLCCSILRTRYLLHNKLLHATPTKGDSPFWKAIMAAKDLIRLGACFLVGNGESINIWEDPRVPSFPGFCPSPKGEPRVGWITVKDLILQPGV
ncbi:hypothetical protein UlMin_031800 [Ulmus minor]